MLKKIGFVCVILLLLVGMNSNASALSLVGFVNPIFNLDNISGTAIYSFSLSADPGDIVTSINWFKMDFLPSAFTSASLLSGPSGMTLSGLGTSALQWGTPLGSPILGVGNSFTFSVDFTLTNPRTSPLYNSPIMWEPGGANTAWQQNFLGFGGSITTGFDGSGGSTALAPEPGTLMLLGWGLISTGVVSRFRRKRRLSKTS